MKPPPPNHPPRFAREQARELEEGQKAEEVLTLPPPSLCEVTPVLCKVAPVILHGVISPEPSSSQHPLHPSPESRKPKPSTLNPQPSTLNPKPETRNPKPETRNPKPETLNPKP